MSEAQLLSLVSVLFSVIIGGLAWIGSRIFKKLDDLSEQLRTGNGEIHDRITILDRRVTAVETKCTYMHRSEK